MQKTKIIGKITLSDNQYTKLLDLGLSTKDIAIDDPENRTDTDEIIRRIGHAEAIIINVFTVITKEVINACKNLKFIQTWSTGLDHIDVEAAKAAGIEIKNVPDFSTESVAEKTLALMIMIANQLRGANNDAMSGGWNYTRFQGIELKGKYLGIVGKGRIALRVAKLARAFGMRVMFTRSNTTKEEMKKMFSQSDFISLHCPLNKRTHHLIGQDEFESMKKGVYFINTSRGGLVNEAALLAALEVGIVRYAGIDVLEVEPPDPNNPLLRHPKVFVTPHIAWNTKEAVQRLSDVCIKNLQEYLAKCKHLEENMR